VRAAPGRSLAPCSHLRSCPFAEAEVRSLRDVAKARDDVDIVIITHSEQDVAQEWFKSVGCVYAALPSCTTS